MIIGIDGNEANEVRNDIGERVGSNVVAFQMLWSLHRNKQNWGGKHQFIIYLRNKPKNDLPPEDSPNWKYEILGVSPFWVGTKLTAKMFSKDRPDVLHSFAHYLPLFSRVAMSCTIHDLGYLRFSDHFKKKDYWQLKHWTAKSLNISKYIIAVSKYTKKDIIKYYPKQAKKISVVYNAHDKERYHSKISEKEIKKVKIKYKMNSGYILFLSTLKPSKNVIGLLKAFQGLNSENYKLVIAGRKGWMYNELSSFIEKEKMESSVVFTGYVKESEKAGLMAGAKALVAPSFYEGFGIHVLESMACGTPVVISRSASLPEVAGSTGIYVDPESTGSIMEGISKVIKMGKLEYNKLSENVVRRSELFSWDKSALQLLEILGK